MKCSKISCDDYDGPSVFTQKVVKARKLHKCCECKRAIVPGEKYLREQGKWDDTWESFKTCKECYEIRKAFCESYLYGQLYFAIFESLRDGDGAIDEDALLGLSPKAFEKIQKVIEEVWESVNEKIETSWIFTFPASNHPYKNGYVRIFAESSDIARQIMFTTFGKNWAFQYDNEEEAGVDRFHLRFIGSNKHAGWAEPDADYVSRQRHHDSHR